MTKTGANVTDLFVRMRAGDPDALKEVVDALYKELHRLAARQMRGEARHHTLQPTALVNEAYIRLLRGPNQVQDRMHFLALAAQAMRRALVDHAREKRSRKRGGKLQRVTLDDVSGQESRVVDVIVMDEALTALAAIDERASRGVELRFFGGHTDEEIAKILGFSLPTVRRDWTFARGWLKARLHAGEPT
jgi:RNA polymerase sigma-70 factor (ECF subfamily)